MSKRTYHYIIDTEGKLWQEGYEFDDSELLAFFFQNMIDLGDGTFEVLCQGEHCLLHPQDVPYVIQDIEIHETEIQLIFPGGYRETLDPSSLEIGKENILYCKVREGKMKARFNRKTYYEIARLIEEEESNFYLRLGGKKFFLSS